MSERNKKEQNPEGKLHIIVTGQNRFPLALDRILTDLEEIADSSDALPLIVYTTWTDVGAGPKTKSNIENGNLILQTFDYRPEFEALGSVTSQLYLTKMASQRLLELGASKSDYILRIRPDVYSQSEIFFSTLYSRLNKLIRAASTDIMVAWIS